ncbi:MAG: DHH family phosphoesterase [Candidatus Micrarchaeia archaeon]
MLSYNKGIVTSIKYSVNPSEDKYTILSKKTFFAIKNSYTLNLGDIVESEDFGSKPIRIVNSMQKPFYEELIQERIKEIYNDANIKNVKTNYESSKLNSVIKMLPLLDKIAQTLLRAIITNTPIVVRFHNDGDGASGALALYKAIKSIEPKVGIPASVSWRMSRGIAYLMDDFNGDEVFFNGFKSIEKPIILIIDFGTNPESEKGLIAAKKYNTIIIDHHILYDGFDSIKPELYINPWNFGSNSNFTAGALAAILAELVSNLDLNIFEKASFISDFSSFASFEAGSKHEKIAVVLDYLTSARKGSGKQIAPPYIDSIISNDDLLQNTYLHAKNLMADSIDAGLRSVKTYQSSLATIHVLNFEDIKNNNDYPLPGRFSSALQQKFEELDNQKSITIVYYGNFISVRISKSISERADILSKINNLKIETNGLVTGGGHKEAVSIKAGEENIRKILKRLLFLFGVRIDETYI